MRTAIIGNSGSGKSTLAKALAREQPRPVLDLDAIFWEPGQIAVERASHARLADLRRFCGERDDWIVEGCYPDLIEATFPWRPELIFLDLNLEACLENCRRRPFEPHKFSSPQEQDRHLAFLLEWVADYFTRSGPLSRAAHGELFDRYDGPKRRITGPPALPAGALP